MEREHFMRLMALLATSVSVQAAAAAPPSATIGQIESRTASGGATMTLDSPPKGEDLARATQIAPENRSPDGDPTGSSLPVDAAAADQAECFLGPQIQAIAAALPLEASGLGDLCLTLVWLENDTPPQTTDRGVRNLQRQEPIPQHTDPEPTDRDALRNSETSVASPEGYTP